MFQESFNEFLFCNFVVAWISSQVPEQVPMYLWMMWAPPTHLCSPKNCKRGILFLGHLVSLEAITTWNWSCYQYSNEHPQPPPNIDGKHSTIFFSTKYWLSHTTTTKHQEYTGAKHLCKELLQHHLWGLHPLTFSIQTELCMFWEDTDYCNLSVNKSFTAD